MQEELEGLAGALQAVAGFAFGQEALVHGFLPGVVDAVGYAREAGIDAGELEVVVDLVKQVTQGGGVAVAGADEAGERGWKLLADGFLKHGAAHDGAGGVETEEIAACRFVEVAVCIFGAGRGHNTLAEVGGARDRRLNHLDELESKGRAEEIVLLGIEGTLDLLPGGRLRAGGGGLQAGERSEAPAGVLDESLAHLLGEAAPPVDERRGVGAISLLELVIDDRGKHCAQFGEATRAGQLGDGMAEFAARGFLGGHGQELLFELRNVHGHRVRGSILPA